jgi:hypothetical protein
MCASHRSAFVFLVLVLSCSLSTLVVSQSFTPEVSAFAGPTAEDPNKGPSEFNHHIIGYGLIGVGALILAGLTWPRLRMIQLGWPLFFILIGVFLAAWSDAEIWPRGNLNWAWLLHHDQEARQHKIYAILLIAIGLIEYLRARGSLGRFWRVWSFPILAIVGAGLLLVHDHTGGGGGHSLEARAYLVNPALDQDGNPSPFDPSAPPVPSHNHAMHHDSSPGTLLVEREHSWFMLVGLAIALFKFVADGSLWRRRFVSYLWPATLVVLGLLLTLYHE